MENTIEQDVINNERIARTVSLDAIEGSIQEYICGLEEHGVVIPKESAKNMYTKVCFLLSFLRKSGIHVLRDRLSDPEVQRVVETQWFKSQECNLKFLQVVLPRLRGKYQK